MNIRKSRRNLATLLAAICLGVVTFFPSLLCAQRDSGGDNLTLTRSEVPTLAQRTSDLKDARFSTDSVVLKVMEQRNIPCRTPGIVNVSKIKEGQLVNEDDLLMALDDRKSRLDSDRLKQEHAKAKKEASTRVELEFQKRSIEVSQVELNRALNSNQRVDGAVAQTEIDQLNLMVQKAIAEKNKIEFQIGLKEMAAEIRGAEYAIGQQKVEEHQIYSPIRGMVVEIFKYPGEWVEMSEPVCRIIRLDKLRAEVKVPAEIALNDLVGSEAVFIPKLPSLNGKSFPAKVIFVVPEANPVNSEMRVWVEIANIDLKLVPGLTGRVTID